MRELLSSQIDIDTRKRLLKAYVWSVALYGCEAWTLGKPEMKRIEAFEMWCYRRMKKIKWIDKITNKRVLEMVGEEKQIIVCIRKRRDRMVGHILRHGGMMKLLFEGIAEGKKCRGRQRLSYLKQIEEDMGVDSYRELRELAQDRALWRKRVSNQS